ncbi:MAG: DUF2141 domain-containing protein [Pseudomonadales bacterium]
MSFYKEVILVLLLTNLFVSFGVAAEPATFSLEVILTGVHSDKGNIRSLLCTSEENFPHSCLIESVSKSQNGMVKIQFENIKAGTYAFVAYHDEDDNLKLNMNKNRRPTEGLAFSKNAIGRMGPPHFTQSAFEIKENTRQSVKFRYLK